MVEAVNFFTTDLAFFGEMSMIAAFEEVSGATEITLVFEHLPPGLRADGNEAGSRLSLEQLARRFECGATDLLLLSPAADRLINLAGT